MAFSAQLFWNQCYVWCICCCVCLCMAVYALCDFKVKSWIQHKLLKDKKKCAVLRSFNESVSIAITLGETRTVFIITTQEKKQNAPCRVVVTTPSKKFVQLTNFKQVADGYSVDFKPGDEGPHSVEVFYDKRPAVDSPFDVDVIGTGPRVQVKGLDTRKLDFIF